MMANYWTLFWSQFYYMPLLYSTDTSPELSATFMGVWLLDLSLTFHKICNTFSDYIRLAIVHLGLPQWPYLLTSNFLSPTYLVSMK